MRLSVVLIILSVLIFSCKKKNYVDVNSIDQIPGKWRWESTCGGIDFNCTFPTKTSYATIEFTTDSKYIEMHNDTLFYQTDYKIIKYDVSFGTLELENSTVSLPVTIVDNRLLITRGEVADSYIKLK